MVTADRPDADDLVVRAALGEPLTAEERDQLDADPALQDEVARLSEVVALAEEAPEDVVDDASLDHLWAGIAAQAFGDTDTSGAAPMDADEHSAEVIPLRRAAPWVALSAVAAGIAIIAALVAVGPFADDAPTPVAVADLAPFADAPVDAVEGQFVTTDGTATLQLDLSALPPRDDAFYEVWLLDADTGRMVSLGPARPDDTYALPQGVEVGDYPSVDVSVEPQDGDPTHSGDSVLRGPVQA